MFQTLFRRAFTILGAIVVLVAIAFVPRLTSTAQAPAPVIASEASAPAANASFDRQFIDMMVPHHQGAVAMARLALTRAGHVQIKRLAQAIVADQASEITQMKAWRQQWYGSAATPSMDAMPMLPDLKMTMDGASMMHDIAHLRTASPFDKAFIDAMTPHHQLAVAAATLELSRGTHPRLKALALTIIKGQSRELGLMQAYRDLWYGSAMHSMSGM